MKRILLLLIILSMFCLPLFAEDTEDSPWNIYAEIDMYMAYKMGIKYEINDRFDFVSSFGINLIENTQYAYSMYASYHTMSNYDKLKVSVNFGIIQGVFDNTTTEYDHYIYINPGVTMHISYPIGNRVRIGAQGGMVIMIGFDQNTWGSSLEPYVGLTFVFAEK
ncbi:MAG: hypothetical protein U9O95_00160 [Candidatus Marinimicrobia bacterium]|nr:hypothetical protein [Candidatus Neomarinimicrobiota bacterium]